MMLISFFIKSLNLFSGFVSNEMNWSFLNRLKKIPESFHLNATGWNLDMGK